ncbi:Uncharacterised protein [Klebsiella pneumoniae]|uniref:Uncharacterized protein n=2 Tax=Klebsiella TaxID=570 RepID=A0A486S0L4_KLEPN|nr:hypothetical protein AI2851V1_2977 [Klebsiella pneumoniae]VGP91487.1 hypothetical protein SB5857_02289 [Klebsiella africana]CAF2530792.1 hypothetical protein AI2854V1_2977 [Klebsiella pneumoniae]CAH5334759.1 hypothetical protein AI2851V1_2977 [Klebsiella pneumoniae]CAH5379289.1 hypothetical protein AI2854V1_2977 [Klebsiella pneumoniae]
MTLTKAQPKLLHATHGTRNGLLMMRLYCYGAKSCHRKAYEANKLCCYAAIAGCREHYIAASAMYQKQKLH